MSIHEEAQVENKYGHKKALLLDLYVRNSVKCNLCWLTSGSILADELTEREKRKIPKRGLFLSIWTERNGMYCYCTKPKQVGIGWQQHVCSLSLLFSEKEALDFFKAALEAHFNVETTMTGWFSGWFLAEDIFF